MVRIRYLIKGDTTKQVALAEAIPLLEKEIDAGHIIYNEDEKKIVTKATMGMLTENCKVTVRPAIAGG